ncbi:MAG TPA: ABC transporter ATP-binding protein [Candidatus Dormibacteraeota bacterium]
MNDDALLRVSDVDVSYGAVQAVRGLSLEIRRGEMVALLGANGAGKTTTLRTISGLLRPTRGSVTFDGRRVDGMPAHKVVGLGIAHVPEGRELFPSLTVQQNLRLGYWSRRKSQADYQQRLEWVLSHFPRLRERATQAAGSLSGGEQQMLVMGRALMSSPRLLLADELSLGLAPMIVEQLFEILRGINEEGTSVLLVEQFVHLALANTDRAYVLAKGRVTIARASSELKDDPELVASYLGGQHNEEVLAT